tara:strand:+ start:110 stop:262 length:153 start_codon:yes stop_codon:yes gene_type:complete
MFNIFKEFIVFLLTKKKYYLIPLIIIMFLLATIMVTGPGSPLAPFIYAVF